MADRDLGLVTNFDPDRMFELPPNQYDPKGYNFPIQGPVDVVRADECDFLRDNEPVVAVHAHGIARDPVRIEHVLDLSRGAGEEAGLDSYGSAEPGHPGA